MESNFVGKVIDLQEIGVIRMQTVEDVREGDSLQGKLQSALHMEYDDNSKQNLWTLSPEKTADLFTDLYGKNDNRFPIGQFAKALGFKVLRRTLTPDNLSGYIACDKELVFPRLIVVNENDNLGHQRFTIAHELWHYIKRVGIIDDLASTGGFYSAYDTDPKAQDGEEREANYFAASLLMPKERFKEAYHSLNKFSYSTPIRELSDMFGVSEKAVETRIKELSL